MKSVSLVLALADGLVLGAVFFGGLWWTVRKGVSSKQPALWFLGSLLLRTGIVAGRFLFHRARPLGEAAGVPAWICRRTPHRDAAHPGAEKPALISAQEVQSCTLAPIKSIFWQHGFLKLNATIVFTWGADARAGRRLETDHAQAVHRPETFPLAEPSGNRRHRHREAN